MIEFHCPECSQKLTIRENRGGTVSRCPRCKAQVTIPQMSEPEPIAEMEEVEEEELALITPVKPLDKAMLDLPDEQDLRERAAERRREEDRLLTALGVQRKPQHMGQRRFPWPIDIVLYPINSSGLMVLAVLIGVPLVFQLLQRLVPQLENAGFVFLAGTFLVGLYAVWYFAECIYDSALGGTRAPGVLGVGASDLWSRVSCLLTVYIVYLLPAVICVMSVDRRSPLFWGVMAYSLVFFPIGLLAMVVNDSISALNPFLLLGSIGRVAGSYIGLLFLFVVLGTLYWLTSQIGIEEGERPFWLEVVGGAASTYATFVLAHLLGRFHWRHADELDWGF